MVSIGADGIGYSSKAIYMGDVDAPTVTAAHTGLTQKDSLTSAPWAYWGTDNKLPIALANDIENCGVLSAALDAKARIAAGKGLQPFLVENVDEEGKEVLTWVDDADIHNFLEANDMFEICLDFSYDKNAYGWRAGSFILSKDGEKIDRITRKDVYECRIEKKNKKGVVENLYMCANWDLNSTGFNEKEHVKVPVLLEGFELWDLEKRKKAGAEFAFIDRRKRNGRQYYPQPLWYAAKEWVKLARSVPGHKNTQFKRQIQLQYVVTISSKYWERLDDNWSTMAADKKMAIVQAKYDEIDTWLSGSDNAYKSIYSFSYVDPVTLKEVSDIKVEAIDDKIKDGKMLPDSAAANSEILFAIMVNPALMGVGQPGGAYSNNAGGSNVRESYLVQMMLMEEERKLNLSALNIVKRFNKWDKKFSKPLVFRYQSGLLTTLDTGKSTKTENL